MMLRDHLIDKLDIHFAKLLLSIVGEFLFTL